MALARKAKLFSAGHQTSTRATGPATRGALPAVELAGKGETRLTGYGWDDDNEPAGDRHRMGHAGTMQKDIGQPIHIRRWHPEGTNQQTAGKKLKDILNFQVCFQICIGI